VDVADRGAEGTVRLMYAVGIDPDQANLLCLVCDKKLGKHGNSSAATEYIRPGPAERIRVESMAFQLAQPCLGQVAVISFRAGTQDRRTFRFS